MTARVLPISLGTFFIVVAPLAGQHDIQRDAVQQISEGRFEEAARLLKGSKKPDSGAGETAFVKMLAHLKQGETDAAATMAAAALEAGLPRERFAAGPRKLLATLPAVEGLELVELVHGPMVGAVTAESASFWVRTRRPATVTVVAGDHRASAPTTRESDFTGVVRIDGLEAGTRYGYRVLVDGDAVPGEYAFTTYPTREKAKPFAVGFGGGAGYIPEWERMWDTIGKFEPRAFLMLGDNVYIDHPEHRLTQRYCYYRRQARPEWRRLTSSTAIYSIWDDHDFGKNDCVPGPDIEKPAWKREVWNVFRQNWVNPSYGGGAEHPGCWFDFRIADVHFIMLDGRYYRDLKGGSMLGPVQKEWFRRTLEASDATFKVIASPVPFSPKIKPGSKDPWDGFPQEREEIFSWIRDGKIEGVFLIAADRHRTDLRTIPNPGAYTLYEFESSRLTNRHTHPVVKTPGLVWGYNQTCSFGLMKFDTTRPDPQVQFEAIDIDGKVIHRHTLKRSELAMP